MPPDDDPSPPDAASELDHVLERAASNRSKCRGCGLRIDKGALRFGEQVENPYNDGVSTLWFHPICAAYKRPDPFLSAAEKHGDVAEAADDMPALQALAEHSHTHRRLQRLDRLERAKSGRATCRHCRERIEQDVLRLKLVWFEAGRFEPSGFVHVGCVPAFCEDDDLDGLLTQLRHFNPDLPEADWPEIVAQLG